MIITSGYFANPSEHHKGWFKIFRGRKIFEIWLGHRWLMVDYES